jgi:hypothetical protein
MLGLHTIHEMVAGAEATGFEPLVKHLRGPGVADSGKSKDALAAQAGA